MSRSDRPTTISPRATMRDRLRDCIRIGERLYGLVDAARDRELFAAAAASFGLRTLSLFDGPLAGYLDHVAPHLVSIDLQSEYIGLWSDHLGRSAGILLITDADAQTLWHHLRKIFHATDDESNEYTFRYYDPRVLRTYLPTCTGDEAREFFGPVRRILVESERPRTILSCQAGRAGVKIDEVPLGDES